MLFIPSGGQLALWAHRLARLGLAEFHLYDRESPPATAQRQAIVATINQRPGCVAQLTGKRSGENYLAPEAIFDACGVSLVVDATRDVPTQFAQQLLRMAEPLTPLSFADIPTELIEAIARDAARDADRVSRFLDALSVTPPGRWLAEKSVKLPGDFLLALGAALRLVFWEQQKLTAHREAGLPAAREALRDVLLAVTVPEAAARIRDLVARVLAFTVERFAWNAGAKLGVDVVLGEAKEDPLLDAVADFLWAQRPR